MEYNENETDSRLKDFLKTLRLQESTISMLLGALVVVVVGVLIYNYFSSINRQAEPEIIAGEVQLIEENGQLVPEGLPQTHIVTKGEYLWQISERYYSSGYNWVDIASENNLVNANYLAEGQELIIPKTAVVGLDLVRGQTAGETDEVGTILTQEYLVVENDSLWQISVRAYGDGYRWPEIWQANLELIANPDLIEKGMLLTLPR